MSVSKTAAIALEERVANLYPAWLAEPFRLWSELYHELGSRPAAGLADWKELLTLQSQWIRLWLSYLLLAQGSGLWLARQPLEDLWPAFPACCQPGASPYLLWQGFEQICGLEQKGPLPFKQMHQWLCKHQTGWGMLLNQLLQPPATELGALREAARYNRERLLELLRSAEFMFSLEIYGLLENKPELKPTRNLGVRYRGRGAMGMLSGALPVGPGGVFLEEPRTGTRFQLPFLRICQQCAQQDRFEPLVWQSRGLSYGQRFIGCPHAPLDVPDELAGGVAPASTYVRSQDLDWDRTLEEAGPEGHAGEPIWVLHCELLLDALITLKDPEQLLAAFERLMRALIRSHEQAGGKLKTIYRGQAATLIFSDRPLEVLTEAQLLQRLLHDYNRLQSMPSSHLQLRIGLDYGSAGLEHEAGPLYGARALARSGEVGQLRVSEAAKAHLTQARFAQSSPCELAGAPAGPTWLLEAPEAGQASPAAQASASPDTATAQAPAAPAGIWPEPVALDPLNPTAAVPDAEPAAPSAETLNDPEVMADVEASVTQEAATPIAESAAEAENPAGAENASETGLPASALGYDLARLSRIQQNHFGMMFRLIYPGRFMMGSPEDEPGRVDDETRHLVVLGRPYYLMTTPVTQKQWEQVMGNNPSFFKHPDCPVERVSWLDVQQFIAKLNRQTAARYRLPTEAEWEYAARAGSSSAWSFGSQARGLREYGWYEANAAEGYEQRRSHPVATRLPNRWGLYDMHGNVWEWVEDWYAEHGAILELDPAGPGLGSERVIKGGRWNSAATNCRSASRSQLAPDESQPGSLGFRLVLAIDHHA